MTMMLTSKDRAAELRAQRSAVSGTNGRILLTWLTLTANIF